jgi:hypothetical protein
MQNRVLKKKNYLLTFLCLVLIQLNPAVHAQVPDYRSVFGDDWDKALSFLEENHGWMSRLLQKYDIPYPEAVAVIFPELVRYSAMRDRMETGVLKALYVNLGQDYADFSIGRFQIKPSFAERIRAEAGSLTGRRPENLFQRINEETSGTEFRSLIVKELEDAESEFRYVIAFYLLCSKKFRTAMPEDDTLRIKFLASAYNTGFWKTADEISSMADKKFFSTRLVTREYYSYSAVSLYWYRKYLGL